MGRGLLPREELGLELGSAPPRTLGAFALDSVGRTSEDCGGLRRLSPRRGQGPSGVRPNGKGSGSQRAEHARGRTGHQGAKTRVSNPDSARTRGQALPPRGRGLNRKCVTDGRVSLARPYVALHGSETRSVAGRRRLRMPGHLSAAFLTTGPLGTLR